MSKLFSLLADAGQYACLYLLDSKIGYFGLKTIEEVVSLVLSFDAVFLFNSNIDINRSVFEIAIQEAILNRKLNCAKYSPTDHEGPLLTLVTKTTMVIYGRTK